MRINLTKKELVNSIYMQVGFSKLISEHFVDEFFSLLILNLRKEKKDIRKFISLIEKTIIETLEFFNIKTFADKENIGIWHNNNNEIKKVAAIGVRVSKWIAYHGFSININNDLKKYDAIIPCGIKDKGVTNLKKIKDQDYSEINQKLIENFISNLQN